MSTTPDGVDMDCPDCNGTGVVDGGPGTDSWDCGFPCARCSAIRDVAAAEAAAACAVTDGHLRVREFMSKARQATPDRPCVPDVATRRLRARLILEEALETVAALGFTPLLMLKAESSGASTVAITDIDLPADRAPDLVGIVDGCEDIRVVTTGTLVACGVMDGATSLAVDLNNLAKFSPGHSWREDGKLLKPPGHQPPDLEKVLRDQGWNP